MKVARIILVILHVVDGERKMEPYIVDGYGARIELVPYSAHLSVECVTTGGKTSPFICGSSIVNQKVVLTAAHCIFGCAASSTIIVSVGHNRKGWGPVSTGEKTLIHDHYEQRATTNDIALISLRTSLVFNAKVSRVALMPHPPYKEEAKVAGWGLINEMEKIKATHLQYTKQYVMSTKDCLNIVRTKPTGTFCAKSKDTSYASRGDSGSALVVRDYIQIGLVSYKKPKYSRSVIVYTDVGYHYNWIVVSTKKILCGDK